MKEIDNFKKQRANENIVMSDDKNLRKLSLDFLCESSKYNYSFNFDWLGVPIIQYPQDMISFQEIVWKIKPDLIIEFGIARGGSLIYSASLLALIDLCEKKSFSLNENKETYRKVLGIDIDIREHNKLELLKHPLSKNIEMIEGSSLDTKIIKKVNDFSKSFKNILVCLDSNHTHHHVLEELNAYANLASINSYCLVFDTVIEDMPKELTENREWGPANSPKSAIREFLKSNTNFMIDKTYQNKSLITSAPDGLKKKIR